ncbi:WD repeat-containing protein 75 [Ischnura elegans]|uniref:WD repeat-containing protein 75 n=1 Tax=Ischnura elegans TaxID=197161 RepID=UPI001ED883DD|nr:WD repeat-containing protein 75 [Ischnura elegans]
MTDARSHVCEGERLVLKRKGGGSIVSLPPVISKDSKVLFVAWGNNVRAYSTQTGNFLMEYCGLSHRCSSFQLLPDVNYLAACSETGEIIFWDSSSGVIQEERQLELLHSALVSGSHFLGKERDILVVLSKDGRKFDRMLRYKSSCKDFDEMDVKLNKKPRSFAVGGHESNLYLGTVHKSTVYAVDIRKGKIVKHFVHSTRRYTCIAAHKREQILAVGGIDGCITIWNTIFNPNFPPRSIYHWHTLPVNAICFSDTGTSMFSGGGECVLVKWLLDHQEKNFVPRMGSPICYLAVAPENQFVVASMADNSIQLISPRLTVERVIQNFTWNVNIANKETNYKGIRRMRFDPRTKSLVLNGLSGHLQFFSTYSNSLLYNLDVVGQNFLTQENNKFIFNTEVMHVAFTCNGSWMATVEVRKDPDSALESRLKFWKFNENKQNFALNTCIESPHSGEIYALEMKPGTEDFHEVMAVTCGDDGKFKIWSLAESAASHEDKVDSGEVWQCESVGSYKGLAAGDVGFSSDGSILGAAFEYTLTLWVPDAPELKASLTHPDFHQNIRHLQFGSGDCCHLIVCTLPECIAVWNILSLTMTWTVPVEINILAADPLSSHMAAFTPSGDLIVFKPSEPQPVLIKPNLGENKILLAEFVPQAKSRSDLMKWQQKSQLYFMNEHQELLVLENQEDRSREAASGGALEGSISNRSDLNLTPFGVFMANTMRVSEVKPVIPSDISCDGILGKDRIEELLRMPVHTMPPLRTMCFSFLTSLFKKQRITEKDEESDMEVDEGKNDDDVDSEDESDRTAVQPGENDSSNNIAKERTAGSQAVRAKLESTPELEAHLQQVVGESADWVKVL